jgi:aspartate 4-decarboxylase
MTLSSDERLSPLEIEDLVILHAHETADISTISLINAGRGRPNWVATDARDAFFLLGQFAMTESRRVLNLPAGIGGLPAPDGIAARLDSWLAANIAAPGATLLARMVPWALARFGFVADRFVHELVDAVLGANYPVPGHMIEHNEVVARDYLQRAICGEPQAHGVFRLHAVEGSTAAIGYIFKSLRNNGLLKAGDAIALSVPRFSPHLEMPLHDDYGLDIVNIHPLGEDHFRIADDLDKLLDPKVKAFFVVNPGGPSARPLSAETIECLGVLLKLRPDLIIITDDAFGNFMPGFRSLLGAFPRNTIGVYSYSQHFGCTGWRLGLIAIHETNICDQLIAWNSTETLERLDRRYETVTPEPRKLSFIDRIVADSREVALDHCCGLSLPQQAMMMLFSLCELMDEDKDYQRACTDMVSDRVGATIAGLGLSDPASPVLDRYRGLINLELWMRQRLGDEVTEWVMANVDPLDPVFRLADENGIVLLNGGGFAAPEWSLRVSFASLPDHVYSEIGRAVRRIARGYREAYELSRAASAD